MVHKKPNLSKHAAVLAVAAILAASAGLLAQLAGPSTPDMTWNTVDGGGGVSSGVAGVITLEITGTIGQHDAFITMSDGGSIEFTPGFWGGVSSHQIDCPADVYPAPLGDDAVNVDDLLLVITSWGVGGAGDATHNGTVNVDDLVLVITQWGACP